MKNIGITLLVAGVVLVAFALNYDTSVSAGPYEARVHNIGLIAEQRTHILIGCVASLAGLVMWIGSVFQGRRPSADRSVADEIAKLSKLHADGFLTEAEFRDQKAKLLS